MLIIPDAPINFLTGVLLDKSTFEHIRIINVFIAIWFALFSIPTFLYVTSDVEKNHDSKKVILGSFNAIKETFNELKKYKQLVRFLLARIVYNDAIITVIAFGGPYAYTQFGFDMDTNGKLMIFGIVLNVFAGVGAFLFGFLDDYIGGKKTVQITNIGFIVALLIAFVAPVLENGEFYFWISGVLVGIFMGPNQAASRSLMGRMIPENKENEFYGFFAFSGKATAFLGPLLFTLVIDFTGDMRWAMLMLAVMFFIGMYILNGVNPNKAIDRA
jgi:UMF1 family MFS transporter